MTKHKKKKEMFGMGPVAANIVHIPSPPPAHCEGHPAANSMAGSIASSSGHPGAGSAPSAGGAAPAGGGGK